jgi:capsular polysaccharide biosynthesis protein
MAYIGNSTILGLIVKYWRPLSIVAVVAALLSAVFSSPLFIDPKYRSYAVLYPANIIPMGTETPTEQMMQVLESDQIRDSLVAFYDLYTVYDINPESKGSKSTLIREYQSLVTTRKTEYESVIIEVLDKDPLRARDMVNSIILNFNRKAKSMQKEKSIELVAILSEQLRLKKHEMDSMEAVLTNIRKDYGILDYDLQTEYATERYLDVITTPSNKNSAKEIEPLLNALKEMGGEFKALNEHLWRTRGSYNDLKEQLEQALKDVEKQLTYCNIITQPEIADRKAYPVRWLIVMASVLSALLTALIILAILENLRSTNRSVEQ